MSWETMFKWKITACQNKTESAWEVPVTMNHTWAYKRDNNHWKSTKYLLWQLTHSVAMNGNYLLNIGPKGDGSIPQASLDRLQQIGKWMQVNKKAIEKAVLALLNKLLDGEVLHNSLVNCI